MKKYLAKFLIMIIAMLTILTGVAFAKEQEYILKSEYVFKNERNSTLNDGYVKVRIGQINFTDYAEDEYLKVTPKPDKLGKDDFGNYYAYFDATGMPRGKKLIIKVERKVKVSDFSTNEPIIARSNGSVTKENEIYVKPQRRVESDNEEIIKKAQEITEGLSSDYRKAEAIFKFVNTKMTYDTSAGNKGALEGLRTMSGVCEEFATLFAALCRAEEIPTRIVAGYSISIENHKEVIADHVWCEIYLDDYGWLPVEPTYIRTIQTIDKSQSEVRAPNWLTFCKLNKADHLPTEIYNMASNSVEYKILTDVSWENELLPVEEATSTLKHQFIDLKGFDWAEPAIQSLYENGITKGYSVREFGPGNNISRIEFMTMLSRALKVKDEECVDEVKVYYYPTYDLNHWSKEDYDFLMKCFQSYTPSDRVSAGYLNVSNVFGSEFDMDRPITRGEVVALMDAFLDEPSSYSLDFMDVDYGDRFVDSIIKASQNGLINGYADGSFRPNNTITRAEMATILSRYISQESFSL